MTCLIIGDSLAVGVGEFRPECDTVAKVGITSQTYLATRFRGARGFRRGRSTGGCRA